MSLFLHFVRIRNEASIRCELCSWGFLGTSSPSEVPRQTPSKLSIFQSQKYLKQAQNYCRIISIFLNYKKISSQNKVNAVKSSQEKNTKHSQKSSSSLSGSKDKKPNVTTFWSQLTIWYLTMRKIPNWILEGNLYFFQQSRSQYRWMQW